LRPKPNPGTHQGLLRGTPIRTPESMARQCGIFRTRDSCRGDNGWVVMLLLRPQRGRSLTVFWTVTAVPYAATGHEPADPVHSGWVAEPSLSAGHAVQSALASESGSSAYEPAAATGCPSAARARSPYNRKTKTDCKLWAEERGKQSSRSCSFGTGRCSSLVLARSSLQILARYGQDRNAANLLRSRAGQAWEKAFGTRHWSPASRHTFA